MKEFIRDVVIAVVIVVLLSLVIKPTIVKESSMENTLHENNYLILNKLAYKTKDHPDYGDIIVFKSDLDGGEGFGISELIGRLTGSDGKKLLIKRVIGVEGDVISVVDGDVYRNGELLEEDYIKCDYDEGTDGYVDELVVPDNQVFVMGDHRSVSLDSRSEEVGTISEDDIVGKAVIRLYPFDQIKRL